MTATNRLFGKYLSSHFNREDMSIYLSIISYEHRIILVPRLDILANYKTP